MPDSYLIDGYNLIHALGLIELPLKPGALEHSRQRLIDFLKDAFPEADAAHITIVFDAKHAPPRLPRQQLRQGISIRFAPKKQTADDLIETLIDEHPQPSKLIVISNDARLKQAASRAGAQAWTDADLHDFLERRRRSPPPVAPGVEEKQLGAMSPEEKEHWRKEFEALEKDPELKEFFDIDRFED